MSLSEFDEELAATGLAYRPCSFCEKIQVLTPKQLTSLNAALDAEQYTAPIIQRVLAKWGVETSATSIQKHRPFGSTAPLRFCARKYPDGKPGPR